MGGGGVKSLIAVPPPFFFLQHDPFSFFRSPCHHWIYSRPFSPVPLFFQNSQCLALFFPTPRVARVTFVRAHVSRGKKNGLGLGFGDKVWGRTLWINIEGKREKGNPETPADGFLHFELYSCVWGGGEVGMLGLPITTCPLLFPHQPPRTGTRTQGRRKPHDRGTIPPHDFRDSCANSLDKPRRNP